MFWSLVRPDKILPQITRSAAVPTSLDADESAGIVQLPGNAPQAAPGQSRGLPRGAGDRRKFSNRRGGGVSKKSSTLLDTAGAKGNAGRSEPTTFNLPLLLQRNNKHAEAVEYWRRYLANDAQSEWAARARRSLKILRNATATLLIAAVFQVAACNALPRPWRGSQRVFLRSGLGLGAGQGNTRAGFPGFPGAFQQRRGGRA